MIISILMLISVALVAVGAYGIGKHRERESERRRQAMAAAVAQLPDRQPEIMRLMHGPGYNYREIAGVLQMPPDYVLEEMAKAYASLRMKQMPIEQRRGRVKTFVSRAFLRLAAF